MNDEIKEILEDLRNKNMSVDDLTHNDKTKLLDYITNLQEENEHLRTQVNTYENPDDYTLFYMWLDAKAKDKMKQLQEENERLKEKENKLQEKFKDWKKRIEKERKHYLCDRTDCFGRIKDSKKYRSLYQENERLNNIINELEDMIVIKLQRDYHESNYRINTGDLEELYDKLKELKEGK